MSEMIPFKFLTSREKALEIFLASVKPIEKTETVPITESSGRVLAEEISADKDVPLFDRAAMDGYAVKAEDTFGASEFTSRQLVVAGVLRAGEVFDKALGKSESVRISTGCPIPKGADAVVMVEFTSEKNGNVVVSRAVYPGANISLKGEDMKKGETMLSPGMVLTPARIGVLAALGRRSVSVYRKPCVAVVPTGTEIVDTGLELEEGQVYDVNSYTLSALLTSNGATTMRFPIVPDSSEQLEDAIAGLIENDLIVFSGGSSVGERDLLARVIEKNGKLLFHGVQIKPGKPTLLGVIKGKVIVGMPGYPASCLSNAYIFLVPVIRKMARLPPKWPSTVKATMAKRIVSSSGREQFLPVKVVDGRAYPVFKKSGDTTSLAKADGYLILPINLDVIEENEEVIVTLFE